MAETGWLVLGANGQLGRALQTQLAARDEVTFWGRDEADLANPQALKAALEGIHPTAIINASAYTAVDKAEEEAELAHRVNGDSVRLLAEYAKMRGISLVHVSTDYVFDGSGDQSRAENEPTNPLNTYGKSKLVGEQAIEAVGGDYLIFRTSWVYDAEGKNFFNTMLRLGQKLEELSVVDDQVGAPTYAPHLAEALVICLDKSLEKESFPSGVYHAAGGGDPISWHGFASAIFERARANGFELKLERLLPIPTSSYPTSAQRPLNSRLSMQKLQSVFGIAMPDWRQGLLECFEAKKQL